jgi:hypothetical protein
MHYINFTFESDIVEDGIVGGLDFATENQFKAFLALLTPEFLKKHRVVEFVVGMKPKNEAAVADAA